MGSIGVFSQTTTPQMPPPHLLTRALRVARLCQPDTAYLANAATTRAKPQVINLKAENNLKGENLGAKNLEPSAGRYPGKPWNPYPEPDMPSKGKFTQRARRGLVTRAGRRDR